MAYETKVLHNKRNNQLFIALSRKKLNIAKDKIPKMIKIKDMEMI